MVGRRDGGPSNRFLRIVCIVEATTLSGLKLARFDGRLINLNTSLHVRLSASEIFATNAEID